MVVSAELQEKLILYDIIQTRNNVGWLVGSLFYDAFSVTKLYSVNARVTSE
jgi:hypothetical protein